MREVARRRTARAFAAVTVAALAATSGVLAAPAASAYYGSTALVRDTVLTTPQIASAAGWNATANPLTGVLTAFPTQGSPDYDWRNTVTTRDPVTATQAAPAFAELWVLPNTSLRGTQFSREVTRLTNYATTNGGSVVSSSGSAITIDVPEANVRATYSLRVAGSDGLAFGACGATPATTTTVSLRAACANAISSAQATRWNNVSPPLVFRTSSQVDARLLTGGQAENAARVPAKISIKTNATSNRGVNFDGRQSLRTFKTVGKEKTLKAKKFASPASTSITQFGNRTNANAAFERQFTSDRSRFGATRINSTNYKYRVDATLRGKKTKQTVVVRLTRATFTSGACVGNPYNKPTASTEQTCAQRVTNAASDRAASLFASIG